MQYLVLQIHSEKRRNGILFESFVIRDLYDGNIFNYRDSRNEVGSFYIPASSLFTHSLFAQVTQVSIIGLLIGGKDSR